MRSPRRRTTAGTLAIIGLLAIVGCTPQQETQASAEAALCASLSAFGDSLQTLEDMDPATASVEDVQAARADIQSAWDDVVEQAADIPEADQAAVDSAWSGVAQAIDDFPTDAPIEEGLTAVQESASGVRSAYQEMSNGVGCS